MKYIKQIMDGSSCAIVPIDGCKELEVKIHDTETGRDILSPAVGLVEQGIYGVANIDYSTYIVPHGKRAVAFCKHIELAETSTVKYRENEFKDADFCWITGYSPFGYTDGNCDHTILSFNMTPAAPVLGGPLGSVVRYIPQFATEPDLCTLYAFLSMLCRGSGLNIFRYKTLHLFSTRQPNASLIRLSQTPEAKRFFMKMWLNS